MRVPRKWAAEVAEPARREIESEANRTLPHEIGGLLIGWVGHGVVHIDQALTIPPAATAPAGYVRVRERAAVELTAALADEPADSPRGYVGEWHSHPANVGPSGTDIRSMRSIAADSATPIVLVVARYSADGAWLLDSRVFRPPAVPWRRPR
mgnify:CR=1 FL=1